MYVDFISDSDQKKKITQTHIYELKNVVETRVILYRYLSFYYHTTTGNVRLLHDCLRRYDLQKSERKRSKR